ncbi:MAG: enterotoxin [Planctomycetota bacterium]
MNVKVPSRCLLVLAMLSLMSPSLLSRLEFPGQAPGAAIGETTGSTFVLRNELLACQWMVSDGHLLFVDATDSSKPPHRVIGGGELFSIVLRDGRRVGSSEMHLASQPVIEHLAADPGATRACERERGVVLSATLDVADAAVRVNFLALLRDNSNYVRWAVTVAAVGDDLEIQEVRLLDVAAAGAALCGEVEGSPVVAKPFFMAVEHPLAVHRVAGERTTGTLAGERSIRKGGELRLSAVIGILPEGQTRRAFLYYLERERACPYRIFLHYNSWYDLGIARPAGKRMTEEECLERIRIFDEELREKRGVALDAYLWDDGWDDPGSLWAFHDGFPRGFRGLCEAAALSRAGMGVWISPWGGYGEARERRLEFGAKEGFEINRSGYSLAGPRYAEHFVATCRAMVLEHGVTAFKFDGVGEGNNASGALSEYSSDVDSLLRLMRDLRLLRPDLFINVTVGTWPSPFWLRYGDSIWRGGADCDYQGEGPKRQQWITYRDAQAYRNIVRRSPLYPLNSLMFHGLLVGDRAEPAAMGIATEDIIDEIRMAIACGTGLQELYVTPTLMPPEAWDALAAAANWARANSGVLVDTHWVGGDPGEGEVYGFASWARWKGILVLRNSGRRSQTLDLRLAEAFELPEGAPLRYRLSEPWEARLDLSGKVLGAREKWSLKLAPFEVLVLEALPVQD